MRGKTWEEQLAILEKSDKSDLELIKNAKKKRGVLTDDKWKLLVGLVGSGLDLLLVFITL